MTAHLRVLDVERTEHAARRTKEERFSAEDAEDARWTQTTNKIVIPAKAGT
jgi:hypothetical protein